MWLRNGDYNKENYKMKITKAQLKRLIKEELIAIHERAAPPGFDEDLYNQAREAEAPPGFDKELYGPAREAALAKAQRRALRRAPMAKKPHTWWRSGFDKDLYNQAREGEAPPGFDKDLYNQAREASPALAKAQRRALRRAPRAQTAWTRAEDKAQASLPRARRMNWAWPGDEYNPNAPAYGGPDYDPAKDASRAEPAYEPEHGIGFTEAEPGQDYNPNAAAADFWKPGMAKPKLPKNWRTLPYKDPQRAAYRDWYKYIKSKRKARARRKALADLSRDAATLPLSDQSRAKMGDPSAGLKPNVRVPPVDPYDPMITWDRGRRFMPRENKITIDSIKELIQEVLSNK